MPDKTDKTIPVEAVSYIEEETRSPGEVQQVDVNEYNTSVNEEAISTPLVETETEDITLETPSEEPSVKEIELTKQPEEAGSIEPTVEETAIEEIDFSKIPGVEDFKDESFPAQIPVDTDFATLADSLIKSPDKIDIDTLKPVKEPEKEVVPVIEEKIQEPVLVQSVDAVEESPQSEPVHIPTLKERMQRDLEEIEKSAKRKKMVLIAATLLIVIGAGSYYTFNMLKSSGDMTVRTAVKKEPPAITKPKSPPVATIEEHTLEISRQSSPENIAQWLFDNGWGISKKDILEQLTSKLDKDMEIVTGKYSFDETLELKDILGRILKPSARPVKVVKKNPPKKVQPSKKPSVKKKVKKPAKKKIVAKPAKKIDRTKLRLQKEEKVAQKQLENSYDALMADVDKTMNLLEKIETRVSK